jgi:predicted CopG family antitoxin
MRTTISVPDDLFSEARRLAGERSFSEFASDAIRWKIEILHREVLARDMEEGYRAEAEHPSLDPAWKSTEVEGL